MLIMSRERGESIMISGRDEDYLVTAVQLRGETATLVVSHANPEAQAAFEAWTTTLAIDSTVNIGSNVAVTLVDLRGENARLGVVAPKETSVHRLEVYDAIRRDTRRASGGDAEDGLSGSAVPRPGGPKPPPLNVRLDEPGPPDEN